ncbi:outer membrane beta-barrel protein [Aequorivita capsosiphonis]|uniref:outer membrane beta-barrel protein n=1 Tax=Aequorivita capsosiphonis TaxID=487317 RepID=UPI00042A6F06|nr:outer membrane beta-barrel protein [Aequorivita capsosiphonis]
MKEKKNIDELFQDGFKNFEATPSPRVWENIKAALNKEKKERKVIPLWIRLGGVAALLALLLTVGNWLYTPDIDQHHITNEDTIQTDEKTRSNQEDIVPESNDSKVASENETLFDESSQDLNASDNTNSKNTKESKSSDEGVISSSKKSASTVIASSNSERTTTSEANNIHEKSQNHSIQKNTSKNKIKEGLASSKATSDKKEKQEINENNLNKGKDVFDLKKEDVAVNGKTESVSTDKQENSLDQNTVKTEAAIATDSKNKKSIFEAISEKDEDKTPKKIVKEKPDHRWNVAPNVAPVYYSSFGNGSSIDPSFTDNPQKGDVNMSYGVQVSYALNKRLSVRTGINNLDLSYSTSDIVVGTGPVAVALRSVDYGSSQNVVTAIDRSTFESATSNNDFGQITPKSTMGNARLIQDINYYEVPLELKYAVVDNKFGVNLIGGISTLFLGNNEVSIKADNFNSVLGEANNLSSVSFSTNVGLGLDYKLSKKFTFNIEPMFKYQLNPYTDSSVNFKPYYLGVYSGLSFKF